MNTSILTQYRQYRQRPTAQGLYSLAERLGLLAYPEPQTGTINAVRQGQVVRRIESNLGNPEQVLTCAIYTKLYEYGIITQAYHNHGIGDDTLTAYCQLRSKGYWTNYLSPEELEIMRPIDDLEAIYAYPVSGAVKEAIEQYFGKREMMA